MQSIPITFEYQGTPFIGYFTRVSGAGESSIWYLFNEGHYYQGRLRMTESGNWVFEGSKMNEMASFFAKMIEDAR